MSKVLTDDWKNKKLKWHKSYFCKNKKGEIAVATLMGEDELYSKELGGTLKRGYWEVLDICDYEELQELKHLEELQANQDKEVESLRDLLKECKTLFKNIEVLDYTQVEKILTRINTAIGESEE